jgi:hypothetical protein
MVRGLTKSIFKKEVLATFKRIAAKVGAKLLQRYLVKYAVPVASIGIGTRCLVCVQSQRRWHVDACQEKERCPLPTVRDATVRDA